MLLARTSFTIALVTLIGLLFWLDHRFDTDIGFTVSIFLCVVLSVQELYDLTHQNGYTPYSVWGTFCAALLVVADWLGHRNFYPNLHWMGIVAFVFLCGLFVLQGWLRPRKQGLTSMAVTAFAIVYVWGLAQFIVRIRYFEPQTVGIRGVLLLVAVVKASDVMAFLVGSRWGRHRPFPHVSPNKSWEGYAAGLAGSLAAALVVGPLLMDMRWYLTLIFAAPVCVFGHIGDLSESIIKRDLGAKDSGVRFPGLGGVLDVVDSLLLGGPVAFYVLEQMYELGVLR
jgi:phosphatidate cytidylyltransferase